MITELTTLAALAEVQLRALKPEPQPILDDPQAVAQDLLSYLESVPKIIRSVVADVIRLLDTASLATHFKAFHDLSGAERTALLREASQTSLSHSLVSIVSGLGWLVIYSREKPRAFIGFKRAGADQPAVDVPEPAPAPLDVEYEVCVVGSGAGGSVVAARLAEAGKNVLVADAGAWISPSRLSRRDDQGLATLYRNGGVQPALPTLADVLEPGGSALINVLQAEVVGGGPYVNNAIHLPMEREAWQRWRSKYGFPIDWAPLLAAMDRAKGDLAVDGLEASRTAGERSEAFAGAVRGLTGGAAASFPWPVETLPVSLWECLGCGGCNLGCPYGRKIGGLHDAAPVSGKPHPSSYFMRAVRAGARVRSRLKAVHFERKLFGSAAALVATDLTSGKTVRVRAKEFVLAAGPIASSRILHQSAVRHFFEPNPIGRNLAANVVTPVYAILDRSMSANPAHPDPGLQMCYFVNPRDGRLLETYFHYPGSIAVSLGAGPTEHARVMREYDRLASCGVVVPSDDIGTVDALGVLTMNLTDRQFDLLVKGIADIARIFFAAGAREVMPAYRTRSPVVLEKDDVGQAESILRKELGGPDGLGLATSHPQGGNALREGRTHGVVSKDFTVYGVENLFVADASVFPAGCGVNPQLTVMGLAHLAADRVLEAVP